MGVIGPAPSRSARRCSKRFAGRYNWSSASDSALCASDTALTDSTSVGSGRSWRRTSGNRVRQLAIRIRAASGSVSAIMAHACPLAVHHDSTACRCSGRRRSSRPRTSRASGRMTWSTRGSPRRVTARSNVECGCFPIGRGCEVAARRDPRPRDPLPPSAPRPPAERTGPG